MSVAEVVKPHMDDLKRCYNCDVEHPRWKFAPRPHNVDGLAGSCRESTAKADRARQALKRKEKRFSASPFGGYASDCI